MADDLGTHPDDLGESRRKLLTIASVLAMETPVVVLDEPTIGLDAHGVARIERGHRPSCAARAARVVAISHDMRFVAETFERVVLLDGGRVTLDGSPSDVFAEAAWPRVARGRPGAAGRGHRRGTPGPRLHPDRGHARGGLRRA